RLGPAHQTLGPHNRQGSAIDQRPQPHGDRPRLPPNGAEARLRRLRRHGQDLGHRGKEVTMRMDMMGTGLFAEPTFEALMASRHQVVGLVTQPDRAVGEKRGSTRQTGKGMKEIALERGVPVYQPDSVNTPEGVAKLREWGPDLLVVAAYGQILSKDVLEAAP